MATGSGKKMGTMLGTGIFTYLFTMNCPCQMGTDGIFDPSKNGFCCGGVRVYCLHFYSGNSAGDGNITFQECF